MKHLFFLLLTFITTVPVSAQTFEEWFRQEQTQEKYLVQQIAALQAYSGTLRQGYALARDGISTVQQIKNGDLGLHQVYFSSLGQVQPAIRNFHYVRDIIGLQAAVLQVWDNPTRAILKTGQLTEPEQAHLLQVKANLLRVCARDLEKLWLLLTPHALEMPDGDRLEQVEVLYRNMLDTHRFTQDFLRQMQLLARQRTREQKNNAGIRALHNQTDVR